MKHGIRKIKNSILQTLRIFNQIYLHFLHQSKEIRQFDTDMHNQESFLTDKKYSHYQNRHVVTIYCSPVFLNIYFHFSAEEC